MRLCRKLKCRARRLSAKEISQVNALIMRVWREKGFDHLRTGFYIKSKNPEVASRKEKTWYGECTYDYTRIRENQEVITENNAKIRIWRKSKNTFHADVDFVRGGVEIYESLILKTK